MLIQVHGKQIDVGDALRAHVTGGVTEAVGKYSERPVEAVVTFSRDRHAYVCDASVHLSTGMTAQARGEANEVYAAFESCLERMEKQLRRYKRRLKNHHQRSDSGLLPALDATYAVLQAEPAGEEAPERFEPVIVAETRTQVPSASVGDAVMMMELANRPFLVFRHEVKGGVNIVYRRDDGNIGWIDLASVAAT